MARSGGWGGRRCGIGSGAGGRTLHSRRDGDISRSCSTRSASTSAVFTASLHTGPGLKPNAVKMALSRSCAMFFSHTDGSGPYWTSVCLACCRNNKSIAIDNGDTRSPIYASCPSCSSATRRSCGVLSAGIRDSTSSECCATLHGNSVIVCPLNRAVRASDHAISPSRICSGFGSRRSTSIPETVCTHALLIPTISPSPVRRSTPAPRRRLYRRPFSERISPRA